MNVLLWAVALVLGLLAACVLSTPVFDRLRQQALRRIVTDVGFVFAAESVDYWCDFGTLLGLHRDGDVILGDKDADFCILESEKHKVLALREAFARRGLYLEELPDRKNGLLRVFDERPPYYADIYVFVRDGEMLRSLLNHPEEDVPERLVTPRVARSFLGTTLLAPADAEALLVHRYGPAFRVPRRNDKGLSRRFSPWVALGEDLEFNFRGMLGLLRARRGARRA